MGDEPLYSHEHGRFVPSEHTRGPWHPDHQHGGAAAALVGRALERVAGDGFAVTRLTLDLLRPVPLTPLVVTAEVTKRGKRSMGMAARVVAGGTTVVDARAAAVRVADLPVGQPPGDDRPVSAGPDSGRHATFGPTDVDQPAFHRTGMDVRFVGGGFDVPGPAQAWFRLRRPVVDDEPPTGLQRAAAAADFNNGISWALPIAEWMFVNPDLSLHLARPPVGEWLALDARTVVSDRGMGMAEGALYDHLGRVGRATQSLVLERRPA
jgi:hypothetical protein